MLNNYGISPEEMIRKSIRRSAVDTAVAFYIRYKGSQASGIIDIATTTGDITLKHGAASSEAADTTVNANGSTPGTIDLSAEATTFKAIANLVNMSDNWEFNFEGALPGDASEASGTAKIVNNITGGDCTTTNGYAVLIDTSTALYHCIGVTNIGPSTGAHSLDAGVYHEITLLKATSTYASGTSTINIYEVDDPAQTSTLLFTIAGGATTAEAKEPTTGNHWPFVNTRGRRLVAKLVNSAAMTAADMTVYYGSHAFAPSTRESKVWSEQQ